VAESAVVELARRQHPMARELEASLRERVMPYWCRTTIEPGTQGYHLFDVYPRSGLGRHWPGWRARITAARRDRHLVGQCRMLFGFSLAHRFGYSTPAHDLLGAAEHGYRFLRSSMLDRAHGGFVWRADADGRVTDARKFLYGQAFAVLGLLEFHRASGRSEPVELALDVHHRVQAHWHDRVHGGWTEHGRADFGPLPRTEGSGAPEPVGLRSANANLHWLEALTELCEVSGAPEVRAALAEALEVTTTRFFPASSAARCQYLTEDWREVDRSLRGVISFGHTVEFAWMMARARTILRLPPSWSYVDALLRHAVNHGFDHRRGGFFTSGPSDGAATDLEKVWWVQAEGLAALSDRLAAAPDAHYAACLDLLLDWLRRYQILPEDAIWVWSVGPDGRIRDRTKASAWKAAYHDVRAMIKFIHQGG